MDELVKLVAQKVGLPEAQAKAAVETVIGFLKSHSQRTRDSAMLIGALHRLDT